MFVIWIFRRISQHSGLGRSRMGCRRTSHGMLSAAMYIWLPTTPYRTFRATELSKWQQIWVKLNGRVIINVKIFVQIRLSFMLPSTFAYSDGFNCQISINVYIYYSLMRIYEYASMHTILLFFFLISFFRDIIMFINSNVNFVMVS